MKVTLTTLTGHKFELDTESEASVGELKVNNYFQ